MSSPTSQRVVESLERMPRLNQWFLSQTKPLTIADPAAFHLWSLIRAMRVGDTIRCHTWTEALRLIMDSKIEMLDHILQADELTNSLGHSLTDVYTPLVEAAILGGEGSRAFIILQKMADLSGLAAFRFLAAWTAFNEDKLSICIAECEKTTEPFAPIHTLLGQALLESGKTSDAIDALKVATKIDPSDPLARVQLIKAYIVLNIPSEAMRVIEECRKILGANLEIECLAAMAIIASPGPKPDFAQKTLVQLGHHLQRQPSDFEAFCLAMDVAIKMSMKDWGKALIESLQLDESKSIGDVIAKLPRILKAMNDLKWHDAAKILLDKTISLTRSQSVEMGIGITQ